MRQFPILGFAGISIAWDIIAPHEAQAKANHYQSLETLARRGGLDPSELVAVLEDRPWHSMGRAAAFVRIRELTEPAADRAGHRGKG